ncbi:MAG: hypothetical protein ACRDOO_17925, partial [Actinomadura sp.]
PGGAVPRGAMPSTGPSGGFSAPRSRPGARPAPPTSPPRSDPLAVARHQLQQEAEQLTRSAAMPADARRRLLSDLRARLDALVVHLKDGGVAEDALAPLVSLLADLRAADEPIEASAISDLWDRTVRVLTEFAGGEPSRRRAFWKRQP